MQEQVITTTLMRSHNKIPSCLLQRENVAQPLQQERKVIRYSFQSSLHYHRCSHACRTQRTRERNYRSEISPMWRELNILKAKNNFNDEQNWIGHQSIENYNESVSERVISDLCRSPSKAETRKISCHEFSLMNHTKRSDGLWRHKRYRGDSNSKDDRRGIKKT